MKKMTSICAVIISFFSIAALAAPLRVMTPEMKAREWRACHQSQKTYSGGEPRISLSAFIEDAKVIDTLDEMAKRHLLRSEVLVQPWSGDYWAYSRGLIAARFQSEDFNLNFDWKDRYQYVLDHPASKLIEAQGQVAVDELSPAEKYDLLIGNENSEFAMSMWKQGQRFYDSQGQVEDWMGICHGWAPASIVEPRPSQSISLDSNDQKWKIRLVPSEIKGLLSYSWATNSYNLVSLGSRCEQKNPKRDENGRLIDPRCQDMNPGTWHQVVINMVGQQQRSFVMDATYDYEVWNQPVKSYSYVYFSKNTQEKSADFKDVILKVQDVKKDVFAKYRDLRTKYIIGVEMDLSYISETNAQPAPEDSEKYDSVVLVTYRYDLELDENHKIIGGEWESAAHPDFVWTPKKSATPHSAYEVGEIMEAWPKEDGRMPKQWSEMARQASPQGQIIHSISYEINQRAQK